MSNSNIEPLQLREWIYDRLRKGPASNSPLELAEVARQIYGQATPSQLPRPMGAYEIPSYISDAVRGVIWELIIQGIVIPGTGIGSGAGSPELPFFQVTEWGKKCLESGEFTPYDTGKYIERLKAKVPYVGSTALLYLTESLSCFRGASYLGSAIMLGVAAETVLLSLRDAIHAALDTQAKKDKFTADTSGRPAKRIYDEVRKRLDPLIRKISGDLSKEDITAEIAGIFDLIRKTRNEVGHPTGRKIEREEAFALLQLFPSYCNISYEVIRWLNGKSI